MNDRFKFRVWNKENKKLYDWDFLEKTKEENTFFWVMHQAQNDCKHNILMQCTGLKDKNGKLIYEGDIVKNNQNSLYYVKFEEFQHQTKFCLKRVEIPNYYPHISTWQGIGYKDQKNYEVIGNIYENKELLEEE